MQVSTEERYALTFYGLFSDTKPVTIMYASHAVLMQRVNACISLGHRIVSVETLESAIRRDAMERGVW